MAASMIRDGETIILDAGSTTLAIARASPAKLGDVAVIPDAIEIAIEHHPGVTLVVTGSTLRACQLSLAAPFGTILLRQSSADTACLSCAGFDASKGFTNSNWAEAEIKQAMIQASSRVVFVADHGKLAHVGTARITGIEDAELLISDASIPPEGLCSLRDVGLPVVTA